MKCVCVCVFGVCTRPVDREYTRLYIFDSQQLTWSQQSTSASRETMAEPIHMAAMEIARCQELVDLEHRRGMMLGAPGGLTVELLEARKVLEVSKWRRDMLIAERDSMVAAPQPRWGLNAVALGRRVLFYGGWLPSRAAGQNETLVLDVEDDLERLRRLEDEFQARIAMERLERDVHGMGMDLQSAYELRMILAAEREREEKERKKMEICDILSRLPELTKPAKVRFVKSNEHTIWVEWSPVLKDAYGKPVTNVEYILSVSGGYIPLGVGDRVKVVPTSAFLKELRARERERERQEKGKAPKKALRGMDAINAAVKVCHYSFRSLSYPYLTRAPCGCYPLALQEAESSKRRRADEGAAEALPFYRGEIVQSRSVLQRAPPFV
jgi:hypothetical protein